MMLGIPWPFHMAFLDSADMMREIRDAIRKTVLETAPIRRDHRRLQPRQRDSLGHRAMARAARRQQFSRRAARSRQADRSRRAFHLLELSVGRISRFEFSRFHFVQRLSASRGGFPPLPDSSDGDKPASCRWCSAKPGWIRFARAKQHQAELLSWQAARRSSSDCRASSCSRSPTNGIPAAPRLPTGHSGWCDAIARPKLAFDAVGESLRERSAASTDSGSESSRGGGRLQRGRDARRMPRVDSRARTIRTTKRSSSMTARPTRLRRSPNQAGVAHRFASSTTVSAAARNAGVDAAIRRDRRVHRRRRARRSRLALSSGRNASRAAVRPRRAARTSRPIRRSRRAAAMAAAPGNAARGARRRRSARATVRMQHGDHARPRCAKVGGFDPMFTAAGDDVDLSWRLAGGG